MRIESRHLADTHDYIGLFPLRFRMDPDPQDRLHQDTA